MVQGLTSLSTIALKGWTSVTAAGYKGVNFNLPILSVMRIVPF